MAYLYCKECGKVIGEFASVLEVTDEYVKPIKKRHEKYCKPVSVKSGECVRLLDELSEGFKDTVKND